MREKIRRRDDRSFVEGSSIKESWEVIRASSLRFKGRASFATLKLKPYLFR